MDEAEKLGLSGKDWLTVIEAAHYCGVHEDTFAKKASEYELHPRNFMGKKLYEKAELYKVIYQSPQWQRSPSIGAMELPTSIGGMAMVVSGNPSVQEVLSRLRRSEPRKKRS